MEGKRLVFLNIHDSPAFDPLYNKIRNVGITYNYWYGNFYAGGGTIPLSDNTEDLPVKLAEHIKENIDPDRNEIYFNVNHFSIFSHWKGKGYEGTREKLSGIYEELQDLCPDIDIIPLSPIDVEYQYSCWDWRPDVHKSV